MRLLIDIGHPAHVHYYKNLAIGLEKKGHKIFWTVKKDCPAQRLLNIYGFKYFVLPKKSDSLLWKVVKQFLYDCILLKLCIQKKITVAIGTSVTIAHVSRMTKLTSIVFDDDDDNVQPLITKFVNPFATILVSPDSLRQRRKRKDTIFYPGYHELAYLHPKRFKADPSILEELGIHPKQSFFVLRFNAFKAHHDHKIKGLTLQQKFQLIEVLKNYGKIFITTERDIENELKQYQLKISPEKIHSLIYYSTMFLGDSQTMSSEASVLGIPSLRCNTFAGKISYLEEQEHKYSLTFAFKPEDFDAFLKKINELLNIPDLKEEWKKRRDDMLKEKIDVTSFWMFLIENYAQSKTLKINEPDFWEKFK